MGLLTSGLPLHHLALEIMFKVPNLMACLSFFQKFIAKKVLLFLFCFHGKYQTYIDRIVKCTPCTHHPASTVNLWPNLFHFIIYLPIHCSPPPPDYFEVNPKYHIISSINISGHLSKEQGLYLATVLRQRKIIDLCFYK